GEHKANKDARQRIVASIISCSVSIVIARLIAWAFPFRVRPISDPTNGLQFPASPVDWENWSSFPSDHAILFFAFTTCLFYTSRALGWIAVFDTVFLVCLPKI